VRSVGTPGNHVGRKGKAQAVGSGGGVGRPGLQEKQTVEVSGGGLQAGKQAAGALAPGGAIGGAKLGKRKKRAA